MSRRDTVVIGASAGGVAALPRILGQLPADFPGSIIMVLHLSPEADTSLAEILNRQSCLPVEWIEQGTRLQPAHAYLAPPRFHALMVDSHLQLVGGAKENHVRPSIDRLFRSAAAIHGSRTIAVLLTGMLDDGVAGMRAVQKAGGFTIVQDPKTAEYPELPSRALVSLLPDRVLPIDAIGGSLVQLTRQPTAPTAPPPRIAAEARLDRCYLGHVTTAQRLLETSTEQIETALWSAIRALYERAMTFDELAGDALRAGNHQSHHIYLTRANIARSQAETARAFMLDLTSSALESPAVIP